MYDVISKVKCILHYFSSTFGLIKEYSTAYNWNMVTNYKPPNNEYRINRNILKRELHVYYNHINSTNSLTHYSYGITGEFILK